MSNVENKLIAFPAFFKVEGEKVAIFGNGDEAFAKLRLLSNTRADIIVYANAPEADLVKFAEKNQVEIVRESFSSKHLENAVMVFAGTGDEALDRHIVEEARALKIPANAVDQPDYCDFYTPALVNRAPLAVAIGTEGAGPVLGQIVRARIDQMLSPSLGPLARLAQEYRKAVDYMLPRGVTRRVFWRRFFTGDIADKVAMGETSQARRIATRILREREEAQGHVWLVGAGPGAEDLLTLRAQRVMMEADVILYDALVPEAVVNMGRRDAERVSVGKRKGCHSKSQDEINALLVELAGSGKRVVRLKSGDPLVYGRAGEEMAALRDANISYEIVPGITSAFAAAADFDLPLTLRGVSSSLVFTTGHDLTGAALPDWARLAISGATIAVYMGRTVAATVASRLMEAGLDENTTVAVVENAGRDTKKMMHGTLKNLPVLENRHDLSGPVMVIIGDSVAGASYENSTPLIQSVPQEQPQNTYLGV
ncbi:MAG: uroporphyrinogen-III C-methyltransferase [Rhizobiaceae bacterium]|nr:uroporphyrinogen-III C-methyltransferase [Rhizobiaceae bacterium]